MTAELRSTSDWQEINVKSSTQISAKVTAVISKLASATDRSIVALIAQARAVNKLISIVEISKRQLKSQKVQVYQYSCLTSEMIEVERKRITMPGSESDGSDDAFERVADTVTKKQRAVPVLTIYLSNQAVAELRQAYGEQEN